MYDYNMLTPGPSKVRKNVLEARAIQAGNSDLDPEFYDFYKRTCAKYSHFLNTANPSFLLSGEGILGLEAACAEIERVCSQAPLYKRCGLRPPHLILPLDSGSGRSPPEA